MKHDEIIDWESSHIHYPSSYKVGIVLAIVMVVGWCLTLFIAVLRPYAELWMGLMFVVPIIGMVYICIKGDPDTMYINILKTGVAYLEMILLLLTGLMVFKDSSFEGLGRALGILLMGQFSVLLVAFVSLIIWIFPGHYLHFIDFRHKLRQQKFQQPLENK